MSSHQQRTTQKFLNFPQNFKRKPQFLNSLIFFIIIQAFFLLNISFSVAQNFVFLKPDSVQNTPFKKEFLLGYKPKKIKQALHEIGRGDIQMQHVKNYDAALNFYIEANKINPNNAILNQKIGACYLLKRHRQLENAEKYLEFSYQLDSSVKNVEAHYYLGRTYHLQRKWNRAIEQYSAYQELLINEEVSIPKIAQVIRYMKECEYGEELSLKKERVILENLGTRINTRFPEIGPVVNDKENLMFFTSRRRGAEGYDKDIDGFHFEDIYISRKRNGTWGSTHKLRTKKVNSKGHEAVVAISHDDSLLIIYRGARKGDLYISKLDDSRISKPKKLPKTINTRYSESSAAFSITGDTLYFTSNRPDMSFGGKDIYMSVKNKRGKWGKPVNLGDKVNSPYDEEGVLLHQGGTMYFSSKGHNTIGGFDVFRTQRNKDGEWKAPTNMGMPLNSPDHDVFLSISNDERRCYYSSDRAASGLGEEDLYVAHLLGIPKTPLLAYESLMMSDQVPITYERIAEDGLVIETQNEVLTLATEVLFPVTFCFSNASIDNSTSAKLLITGDNSFSFEKDYTLYKGVGEKITVSLPKNRLFNLTLQVEGQGYFTTSFSVESEKSLEFCYENIELEGFPLAGTLVIEDIFFDTGKALLKPNTGALLQNLLKALKANSNLKIAISGHTDTVGGEILNQKLSERRATAVRNYLVSEGISEERITTKGFGFRKPIATNNTPEGRQKNRRVEINIL